MTEISPTDFLYPLLPRNPIDLARVSEVGDDIAQQLLDSAVSESLLTVGFTNHQIQLDPSVFVAFVSNLLEQVRGRSIAPGSIYAVRVRDPPWFRLEKSEMEAGLVPGIEVGSLLGDDLANTDPAGVRRSLQMIAARSTIVEVALGHVGTERRVLTFRLVGQ